jgi:uncharacterized membrane protein YgcG
MGSIIQEETQMNIAQRELELVGTWVESLWSEYLSTIIEIATSKKSPDVDRLVELRRLLDEGRRALAEVRQYSTKGADAKFFEWSGGGGGFGGGGTSGSW